MSSEPRPSCSIIPEEATLTEEDTGCQVSADTTLSTSQAGQAIPGPGREEEDQGEARIVVAEETGGSGTDNIFTYPTDRGHYATNVDPKAAFFRVVLHHYNQGWNQMTTYMAMLFGQGRLHVL